MARLILVADDSPTVQRRAQGILQHEGFEVETVSNGVAAIKKLPKLHPILVLADVSMPGKDGYEVCEYVKTSVDFRHVPVLLVASDQEPYDERRGAEVGADGTIKKPFTPHDLIAMAAEFAAFGEAAASRSTFSDPLANSSPAASDEVPPIDPELEGPRGSQPPDSDVLSAGVTVAGPFPDSMPAAEPEPWVDFPLPPSPEPAPQIPVQSSLETRLETPTEDVLGDSSEPIFEIPAEPPPEFTLELPPEPISGPAFEAAMEPTVPAAESVFESPLEVALEPIAVTPEAIPEAVLEAAPELVPATAESISGTALEAAPEPISPETVSEPSLDAASPPAPELGVPSALEPAAETGHPPEDSALEPPPNVPAKEPSLAEAPEEPVYIAPPETEAASTPEPEFVQPGEAAAATPSVIDPQSVHVIVQKAVVKMSPPALSLEVVEELIRRLTEEITGELNAESSK